MVDLQASGVLSPPCSELELRLNGRESHFYPSQLNKGKNVNASVRRSDETCEPPNSNPGVINTSSQPETTNDEALLFPTSARSDRQILSRKKSTESKYKRFFSSAFPDVHRFQANR